MAVNEKSLKNIKPIQPGEVRNPNGKAKGTVALKTVIKKWLAVKDNFKNPITGNEEKMTTLDVAVLQQLHKAMEGDTAAFKELMDRTEGKAPQSVKLGGEDGGAIPITLPDIPNLSKEELIQYLSGKR